MKLMSKNSECCLFTEVNGGVFFYSESVVFPYVQFSHKKKGFFISMEEYVDVLNAIENLYA